VDAIIIPSRGSAQINADAVKTSAGALHKIAVCRSQNLKTTLSFLHDSGIQIVACTEKTDNEYTSQDYAQPTAIIMGSEDEGISGEYLKLSNSRAKIPLLGKIQSLNVSVACGVILYEVIRQRKMNGVV
jgi:23S rRNA (guanosine2251-2'-O)-methyltransferase